MNKAQKPREKGRIFVMIFRELEGKKQFADLAMVDFATAAAAHEWIKEHGEVGVTYTVMRQLGPNITPTTKTVTFLKRS